jgi:tetraacyldisaccharide 4'-kinase
MEALRSWLERGWYGGGAARYLLLPLVPVYAAIVALRRAAYARGLFHAHRVPRPVIVVGNLTVGGTGKTPLTVWLANALEARGLRVGVVSRGYGGRAEGPVRVRAESDPAEVGDEPVLIAARTGAAVVVARDRAVAARQLVADVDVLIADDGLQHYRLARDLEFLVVDGRRGFGNGWLLPAGPLREPPGRADDVHARIVNGGPLDAALEARLERGPATFRMSLVPGDVVALAGGARMPLAAWAGRRVHAVAGIGDPERFFATLAAAGIDAIAHPFPDHARYAAADLAFGDDLPVLMTEKDAVKCRAFADARLHYLEVGAALEDGAEARLVELALSTLARRRR